MWDPAYIVCVACVVQMAGNVRSQVVVVLVLDVVAVVVLIVVAGTTGALTGMVFMRQFSFLFLQLQQWKKRKKKMVVVDVVEVVSVRIFKVVVKVAASCGVLRYHV